MLKFAWFITPHGYGHATRSLALMHALRAQCPQTEFLIFTTVGEPLFRELLGSGFTLVPYSCDVGLAQKSAMAIDFPATLVRLADIVPFSASSVAQLSQRVREERCVAVVADVAALGIVVAEAAGRPSILVENFTWPFIYGPFASDYPAFADFGAYLSGIEARVTLHIQTEPVCSPKEHALTVGPMARPLRDPTAMRAHLRNLSGGRALVLLTMGGVAQSFGFHHQLVQFAETAFFFTTGTLTEPLTNVCALRDLPDLYHPDLIAAMDLVVAKLGYSTVAEIFQAGVPLAYVSRSDFRESPSLETFVATWGNAVRLEEPSFLEGTWLARLPELLALPKQPQRVLDGPTQAARVLLAQVGYQDSLD